MSRRGPNQLGLNQPGLSQHSLNRRGKCRRVPKQPVTGTAAQQPHWNQSGMAAKLPPPPKTLQAVRPREIA